MLSAAPTGSGLHTAQVFASEIQALQGEAAVIPAPLLLAAMCDMQEFRFLVHGLASSSQAVLADEMLFPAVAWVAQNNARTLMQADLGYRFEPDAQSLMGVRASGPPVTAHIADLYRVLFLMDACITMFNVAPRASVEISTVVDQLRDMLFADVLQDLGARRRRQAPASMPVQQVQPEPAAAKA